MERPLAAGAGHGDGLRTREGTEEYAPKGWKSRVVPLSVRLVEALARLVRSLRDPHVLLDRNGEPLTTTQRYMHATPGAVDAAIAKLAEEVEGVASFIGAPT